MLIISYLKLIFIFIILSIPCFSFGQNMNIYGTVNDTLNKRPKENAVVMLVRLSDSVLIDFQRTNENGEFYISTPMDTVEIIISHHDNDDKIKFFLLSSPRILLKTFTLELLIETFFDKIWLMYLKASKA